MTTDEPHFSVGPDLFTAMLNDKESGIKHFLLGDTEETLALMKEKYADNGANIVGSYSPPFCELDEFDYPSIAYLRIALSTKPRNALMRG